MDKFKNLICFIALCILSHASFGQTNPNIIRTAEKIFSVGIYGSPLRFEKMTAASDRQVVLGDATEARSPDKKLATPDPKADLFWNWATCIVICLNQGGLNVSQEQVMSLSDGWPQALYGTPQDLMFAVNKTTPRQWGKASKITSVTATLNADLLFDELSEGRPVVFASGSVGTEGRAFIISAMSYSIYMDAAGNQTGITPISITLRDPWPRGLSNSTFQWSDFVAMAASVYTIRVDYKK